jgi:phenylacetic acid degradation protein/carnitine operon protein CaiE
MNSVIMDNVELGDESIAGALSFIRAEEKIPQRSLVIGNPGRIIRKVSDEMIAWKTKGTELYQQLPKEMSNNFESCQPLAEIPPNRPMQEMLYETWNRIKAK